MDPYDEFTSGYVGMGNDPVNMVDPSGGLSMSAIGDVLSQVACPTWGNGLTQLFTTAAKIGSMGSMLNMLTQMHTRTLQAELIAGQLMANVATQAGDGHNKDGDGPDPQSGGGSDDWNETNDGDGWTMFKSQSEIKIGSKYDQKDNFNSCLSSSNKCNRFVSPSGRREAKA
jgi:hypothetical protein